MPVNSFENYPMSWKPVIDKNSKSLYRVLAEQLESDIICGLLLPGTKLPPQRELADYLDINVSTVSKAMKICELKGLLSSTTGSGTFVSFDSLSNAYLLTEGNPNRLIEMGATVPENSVNASLLTLMKNMLGESCAEKWFSYNRPGEALWHKDAAVRLLKKCGIETEHDNILISHGGQNALTAILAGLFHQGDKIGVDPHTYSGIKTSAAMLGIQLVPIRQTDDQMDIEALVATCQNEGIKGIYIIPTHHNPTTHTMTVQTRKAVAEAARKHDILIIEDGTYQLMCKPIPPVSSFAPERSIYIASLSKTIAPGLRMAYISIPTQIKPLVSGALYNLNVSVTPMMAELSARVVVSGQLDVILENHKVNTRARNRLVDKYMEGIDCRGDDTCIFRWLYLTPNMTGTEFERQALSQGIQVYAAERFVVGAAIPDHAIRLAICAPETIEELEKGLVILRKLLVK